jgi:hypothetical protein
VGVFLISPAGLCLIAFVAFSFVVYQWGEDYILPGMFFVSVVYFAAELLARAVGVSL